jgi:sugar-specific transcriptional regulator TrmB
MMKEEVLCELGLSKNEIATYLKLLELRTATAVEVAKETRLHRPNVYDALNRLVKKGLVSHYTQEKVKYFEVVDPEQLMNLLKAKELKLQQILPELKIMQFEAKPPSKVSIMEGIAGTRKIFMDLITGTKELYVFGAPREIVRIMGTAWMNEWHQERIKRKVMFHHVVNEDYPVERIKLIRKMKYTNIKFLHKKYNAPHLTFVNDHGIVFVFVNPLISIKIYRPEVAKSFKQYYKMLEELAMAKAPQEK